MAQQRVKQNQYGKEATALYDHLSSPTFSQSMTPVTQSRQQPILYQIPELRLYTALQDNDLDAIPYLLSVVPIKTISRKCLNEGLWLTAQRGHVAAVAALLKAGADAISKDMNDFGEQERGRTALIYAVQNKHYSVMRLILKSCKDTLQQRYGGENALDMAANAQDATAVKILLHYGATPFYFRKTYEILSFIDQCKKEMWREKTARRESLPKSPVAVSLEITDEAELLELEKMVDKLTTDHRDIKLAPSSSYANLGVALRPIATLKDDQSALATPVARKSSQILHFFQELNRPQESVASAAFPVVESPLKDSAPKNTAALTS